MIDVTTDADRIAAALPTEEEVRAKLDYELEHRGVPTRVRDLPVPVRYWYGYGHVPERGREAVPHPERDTGGAWRYPPDECPIADRTRGVWIRDEQFLVCPGCGMDYT